MRPLYLSLISVPFQPSAALAARQSCQCQPLFVRPGRARLDRTTFRTRAQEGEKQDIKEDIKEEIKQDLRVVKGFFTGSSNAVRLSPVLSIILCSSSLRYRVLDWSSLSTFGATCSPEATLKRILLDNPTFLRWRYVPPS